MKRLLIFAAIVSASCNAAFAEDYDFFGRARYPGPRKVPGVDLYRVEQGGGPHAEGYQRRVVDWWPRRGIDVIEVEDGMPLRTWTLRERTLDTAACVVHPELGTEEFTRRLNPSQPRQFRAHLIAFRGIGNRYGDPFRFLPYFCPAAVLRLEDGTKRCFTRGTFVEEDERYLLDLYVKEMERIRGTLSDATYELAGGLMREWPDNAEPGEPGTMRVESEHFVWVSGSQHAPNEGYSPWVNRDEPDKARLYREGSVAFAEDMWAYQEHAGVLMPYWDRRERLKYAITVCGTYVNGHRWIGGYAGGGYGGCGIKHAGGGVWSFLLAHEWGHGLPLQTKVDGGGGEILADVCVIVDDPARGEKFANNVCRPWRNCVHGAYATGLFHAMMADDPNWGYAALIALPVGRDEPSIFHTLARVGEQRGLFANGIRGVGDMVGEFAARQAEFDCELQDTMRRAFVSVKRNHLEAIDRDAGLYRISWSEAPEPYGVNVIRLVPKPADGPSQRERTIAVDFRGLYDPATHGDWRACIVAVGADGRARYSPLWNQGTMEMAVKPGDRRYWLTVAATPSALPHIPSGRGIGVLLNGRHAYRYPYEVKLSGCRPGTPHNMPGDSEDYTLSHLGLHRRRDTGGLCVIPYPGDAPEAAMLRKTVPRLRAELDAFNEEMDRLIADGQIATDDWWYTRRFAPEQSFLNSYVDWMLAGVVGGRHPNGGGGGAASAEVADTAYVAPDAMVLDGAKVLDRAAVEDYAVVRGPGAIVSGNAKVGGQAYVAGNVEIGGYTRVLHPIVADDAPIVPYEVPLRPFQEPDEDDKLWANYALDREEQQVLEDWFRYKQNHSICYQYDELNLNGRLHGRPEFVVDGDRRGFRFDGRTQYAEASPLLADLGQITVDVALKWEGGENQAVFDFGSSEDNRFVLTPSGDSGQAELVVTLQGKAEQIVADVPLPRDKWAECRVEIDGRTIAIWIDGRKAAAARSAFHPADVFPPGVEKRNFLAASRDGGAKFRGVLDFVRVYHAVFDDFAELPSPRRHAPRRVTREFIDTCRAQYAGADLRDALIDAKVRPEYAFYEEIGRKRDERIREIEAGDEALAEARRKLGEIGREMGQRQAELRAEFEKLPTTLRAVEARRTLDAQIRELETRRNEIVKTLEAKAIDDHRALIESEDRAVAESKAKREQAEAELKRLDESFLAEAERAEPEDELRRAIYLANLKRASEEHPRWRTARERAAAEAGEIGGRRHRRLQLLIADNAELARLEREIKALRGQTEQLRTDSRDYVDSRTVEMRQKVIAAEIEVGEALRRHTVKYKPEYDWLLTLRWLAFSGHYNYPYRSYIRERIAKEVGGRACHEEFGTLESIYTLQSETKWHTRCDWDWRLAQEIDRSIEELPLLQAWLKRARGDVKP